MSGELIFGVWWFFCGFLGAWRLSRHHKNNLFGEAWKVEVVLTVGCFAVGIALLAHVIYSRILS
jgi:hypothetical protein